MLSFLLLLFLFIINTYSSSSKILNCIENALIHENNDCYYPEITSSEAIRELRDKWIVFMGESTLRQLFLQFLGIIKSQPFDHISDQKDNKKIEERLAGSRYTFYYFEYYDNLTKILLNGPPKLYDGRYPDLLILNDGLHDLLYDYKNINKSWNKLSNIIINFRKKYNYKVPMMWIPSPQIYDNYLTKHRKDSLIFNNKTLYKNIILKQEKLYKSGNGYYYYYNIFRNISYNKWNFDGIHNMQRARIEAKGLISTFYYLNKDSLTWKNDQITTGQIMTLLFYSIILIIVTIGQILKFLYYKQKKNIINNNKEIANNDIELETLLPSSTNKNETLSVKFIFSIIIIL